jgi:surface antigen
MRLAFFLMVALLAVPLASYGWAGPSADDAPATAPGNTSPGAGMVIGGILGNKISRGMSDDDRRIAAEAEYHALEYGEPGILAPWTNPATLSSGVILPGKPYPEGDEYCRTYTHTIHLNDESVTVQGLACRKPDGTWRATSS